MSHHAVWFDNSRSPTDQGKKSGGKSGKGRATLSLRQAVIVVVVIVVVLVVIPNGLVMDLWAKHTFSKNMYKTIGKHYTVEQPMLQKSHKK